MPSPNQGIGISGNKVRRKLINETQFIKLYLGTVNRQTL